MAGDRTMAGAARDRAQKLERLLRQPVSTASDATTSPFAITEALIEIPYGVLEANDVVPDAVVTPSSKVMVGWGNCTAADENSPLMDDVSFLAVPGSGQFTVYVRSEHPIGGEFRLNYLVY